MAVCEYEAVSGDGKLITGKIESTSISTAIEQLQSNGYMVIKIREVKDFKWPNFTLFKPKVKLDEIGFFSRQLGVMMEAGIPIARALITLGSQIKNPVFRSAIEDIAANVEGGTAVSEAFSLHPNIFNQLYLGMISAGEAGGNLEETLIRISVQTQREKTLKDNIKSAVRYPIGVLFFATLILIAMLIFFVPIFEKFFTENMQIPMLTKCLIVLSRSMRYNWYLWLAVLSLLAISIVYYTKSPKGYLKWDRVRYKIPGFGPLFHKTIIGRFSSVLAVLLNSGISITQALETAASASGSPLLENIVKQAISQIQEGSNVSEPLEASGFFPPTMIQMIRVGEETGALPELLSRVSVFYEEEAALLSKNLTSMLEPLLIIFVGILIAVMLIGLYLPIFTVISQTGMG